MAVAHSMGTRMLRLEMESPVLVEVTVSSQGAQFQHRFGPAQRPARSRLVHTVAHEIAARAFNNAGGDGQSIGESLRVFEQLAILAEIPGAFVHGGAIFELLKRRAPGHP